MVEVQFVLKQGRLKVVPLGFAVAICFLQISCSGETSLDADYRSRCLSQLTKTRRIHLLDRSSSKSIYYMTDDNPEFSKVLNWISRNSQCLKEDNRMGTSRYASVMISCFDIRERPRPPQDTNLDRDLFSVEVTPESMGCDELEFVRKLNELKSLFIKGKCETGEFT